MTADEFWNRSWDACAGMLRCGNTVADENILTVLEALEELNDNVANGRAKQIVQEDVDKIKALPDVVAEGEDDGICYGDFDWVSADAALDWHCRLGNAHGS